MQTSTAISSAGRHGSVETLGTLPYASVKPYVPAKALAPAVEPGVSTANEKPDNEQRAKRKQFDATAEVPCAQERDTELGTCTVGVARGKDGDATAALTFANGFTRYLYFSQGEFVRGGVTMSGTGKDIAWQISDGVYDIRVDDQRVQIPVPLIIED